MRTNMQTTTKLNKVEETAFMKISANIIDRQASTLSSIQRIPPNENEGCLNNDITKINYSVDIQSKNHKQRPIVV